MEGEASVMPTSRSRRLSLAVAGSVRTLPAMGAHVLVVDDDADIRESLAHVLAEEGYQVSEAANGLQALAEMERGHPDVVLLDLMMPVMDGWKTLEILRRTPRHAGVPVVILSAAPAPGAADYIQKAILLDKLLLLLDVVRAKAEQATKANARVD
jgi:CheY-like chemotaxis protein